MLIDYKIHHNFFFACVDVKLIKLLMVVFFLISLLFLLVLFFILCMLASRVSISTPTNLCLVLVSFPTSGFFYGYWDSHSATTSGCFTHTWKGPMYWSSFVPICSYNSYAVHSNSMQLFHIAGSPLKGFPHSPLVRFSRTPSPTPTHPQSQRTPLSYKAKLHLWPALITGNLSIRHCLDHKTIAPHGP